MTIPGGDARELSAIFSVPREGIVVAALLSWILAISFGLRKNLRASELFAAIVVGLAVWLGWWLTYVLAQNSFELVAVQSVTFTGPSTDTLMALINTPKVRWDFGTGLVPGVFVGALCVALAKGEARLQRFETDTPMERYLFGGMLMGFGAMLAGGCAVGAGVTGGAALSLTAWVAIFAMWVGAVGVQWLIRVTA